MLAGACANGLQEAGAQAKGIVCNFEAVTYRDMGITRDGPRSHARTLSLCDDASRAFVENDRFASAVLGSAH